MGEPFNARKAAQLAAFFALQEGGTINVLKLVKLIYLADRAFLAKYDSSMLNDNLVSMEHGPVNSTTLNQINGLRPDNGWGEFVTDRADHFVGVASDNISVDVLDELSRAELRILAEVWEQLGHLDQWQLVKYTHDNCPEWEDPDKSSIPIPYQRLFQAIGKERVNELGHKIALDRRLSSALRD